MSISMNMAEDVLERFQDRIGDSWEKITDEQRESLKLGAKMVFELGLRQKGGEDVSARLQAAESILLDWAAWAEAELRLAFLEVVKEVAKDLGVFLAKFAQGAVAGFLL